MIGKSGFGKTTLLKTAVVALSELGYSNKCEQIYINTYTNEEIFGKIDQCNGSMKEGLISNTLRHFNGNTSYNILNIIGESTPDVCYLYDSLFSHDSIFLNQNNEKIVTDKMNLNLMWEVSQFYLKQYLNICIYIFVLIRLMMFQI